VILVLSWNVHVGGGRVMDVVDWIRKKVEAEDGRVGFVLLLQETHRQGADIPPYVAHAHVPDAIRPVRPTLDVAALGRYLNMSVAYVPSMRNGKGDGPLEREDRGCAVLTTEEMSDIHAIELPFGKQRRVVVMATITPRGMLPTMRVMSAHLDTGFIGVKHQRRQAEALAVRISEFMAQTSSPPFLIGIDANAKKGKSDDVIKRLERAIPLIESCDTRPTMPFRLRFDFLFSTLDPSRVRGCETLPHEYGSDHKPIMLRIANP
jgi:endonuclease/exonuclease/phosphatase family metal-dependent hydrolase